MSGTPLPYYLRQNKAIDRYAFIDLLLKINRFCEVSEYMYVGFGGHSLEDFKYLHSQFGISKMVSLEKNKDVYDRQLFNKPISCVECLNIDSGDFIGSFERTECMIIWLDYVVPSELLTQLEEFQALLPELLPFDIVKVTLNANPASLIAAPEKMDSQEIRNFRHIKLGERIGPLLPTNVTPEMLINAEYPDALCKILQLCANLALKAQPNIYFQPLSAFSYADGQQMFTLTGILLEDSQTEEFLEKTKINSWNLRNLDWGVPQKINVLDFTFKERLHTDSLLPDFKPEEIQKKLGILFDKNSSASLRMLETYALFYRHSPQFSKVII